MDNTFSVGSSSSKVAASNLEEENEEDIIGPDLSRSLVERIRSFDTMPEMLNFLIEFRPDELKIGREHYLDERELDELMSGMGLKLNIHGYEDRAERLKYLHSILSRKFAEKRDVFKIIIQFLIEMSQRPTSVTNLVLSTVEYSPDPDEESSIDEDSERQKALLREILSETDPGGISGEMLHFSSDSDLSEWSSDEESEEEKSNNDIPLIKKVRHSSSFGEFSDITESNPDPESLKQEIQLYWSQARSQANQYLFQEIRKFDSVPLTSQPVISSLLVLQSRFGEFWEWKRYSKQKSLSVAFEEDVVREILWQFHITNSQNSPLYTEKWCVKAHLMVGTLSQSSFLTVVNKYGNTFMKLQKLRHFAKIVEGSSTKDPGEKFLPPSKVYRNYAAGLQGVSQYITGRISLIERELKRKCRNLNDKSEPACTTLLQLNLKTRSLLRIIDILYEVHMKSIPESEEEPSLPWLASVRLISCLENHLLLQTKPELYGTLLFVFSKCLYAALDEILAALKTLKWDENYSLFVRNVAVHLNDSNFWSDCVKVRPYQDELRSSGISPLKCLENILPKALNILKTCEVLDQLEEDFSRILGKSDIVIGDVIQEFLNESLIFCESNNDNVKNKNASDESIDFIKHFNYIGLGTSYVTDSVRFLTEPEYFPIKEKRIYKFEDFIRCSSIPIFSHTVTLDKILAKWFNPLCITAKENIQKIFQDYKVIESMTVFQEIILAVREDFAKAVIEIASDHNHSEAYKYEDNLNRNPKYQKLLTECYPEGRENFTVDLKLDSSSDMNCTFQVMPHFPLNLIVTPQSVAGYLFIGRQLHRIRKSLWDVCSLSMKDCKSTEGVDITRLRMFRFCLINFCSSIRSFFTLKLFSKDFSEFAKSASYEDDLDSIRRVHEDYLESIETRMLRNPIIENVIIRKIAVMSEVLRKRWTTGIPQPTMLMLEDTLKKCWHVVNDFQSTKHSFDFNELAFHFGSPPTCL